MAAYLKVASMTVSVHSPLLTVLVIADHHFPSPILSATSLHYHLIPHLYSQFDLLSLSTYQKIYALNNDSLLVTTDITHPPYGVISINTAEVNSTPIYSDGKVGIYEVSRPIDPHLAILHQFHLLIRSGDGLLSLKLPATINLWKEFSKFVTAILCVVLSILIFMHRRMKGLKLLNEQVHKELLDARSMRRQLQGCAA